MSSHAHQRWPLRYPKAIGLADRKVAGGQLGRAIFERPPLALGFPTGAAAGVLPLNEVRARALSPLSLRVSCKHPILDGTPRLGAHRVGTAEARKQARVVP